jgi:ribonuclease HI
MKWYCDGSGWNGKSSGYAVVPEKGAAIVVCETIEKTNNIREYEAVIRALGMCGINDEIFTDSALVVNQVNGKWRIKESHLKPLCAEAQKFMQDKSATLTWIPREENKAGKYF